MLKRALQFALLMCSITLLMASCSIKSEIYVNTAGAGEVSFRLELSEFLLTSLGDIAEMSGAENVGTEDGTLDEARMRAGFEGKELMELTSFEYADPELMTGTFTFGAIDAIFKGKEGISDTGILTFSTDGKQKTITVFLGRENFADLTDFVPLLQNPFVEMFGPSENEDISAEEYLDMMGFALGEEGPPLIESSVVEMLINVDGTIISHQGGELTDGNLLISIPLLDLLLLTEPIEYSVTYQ